MPIIPLFVSSTFRDFHSERDALRHQVVGALNDLLAGSGSQLELVDLRWGATTSSLDEEQRSEQVLEVCVDEIRRTQPLFLGLVGDRFGWVPPRAPLERALHRAGLTDVPDDLSVTALEIHLGAIHTDSQDAVVLVRDLDGETPESWTEHEHAPAVAALRRQLTEGELTQVRVDRYRATVHPDGRVDTDSFVEVAVEALRGPVLRRAAELSQLTHRYPLAEALLLDQRHGLAGNETYAQQIHDELLAGRSLALHGPAGAGKTTLWCRVLEELRSEGHQPVSVALGELPGAASHLAVLQVLLAQLYPAPGEVLDAFDGITDRTRLEQRLQELVLDGLRRPGTGPLLIDDLDQLPPSAAQKLADLARSVTEHVAVLMTSREPSLLTRPLTDDSGQRTAAPVVLPAELGSEDAVRAFAALAAKRGRPVVAPAVSDHIARRARSPVWIIAAEAALNELGHREFSAADEDGDDAGRHERLLVTTVAELPDDGDQALGSVLQRIAGRFPPGVVHRLSTLLAISRRGLTPAELAEVAAVSALDVSSFRYAMGGLLRSRDLDGTMCLELAHDAVRRFWLERVEPEQRATMHAELAQQLLAQPLLHEPTDGHNLDLRQRIRVELLWHLLAARRFAGANDLLNRADTSWLRDGTLLELADVLAELQLPEQMAWDAVGLEPAGLIALARTLKLRHETELVVSFSRFEEQAFLAVADRLVPAMQTADPATAHELWMETTQAGWYVAYRLTKQALQTEGEQQGQLMRQALAGHRLMHVPAPNDRARGERGVYHRWLSSRAISLLSLMDIRELQPEQVTSSEVVELLLELCTEARDRDLQPAQPEDTALLHLLKAVLDKATEYGRFSVRDQQRLRYHRSRFEPRFAGLPPFALPGAAGIIP